MNLKMFATIESRINLLPRLNPFEFEFYYKIGQMRDFAQVSSQRSPNPAQATH